MAQVTLKGGPVQVEGNLPEVGSKAHAYTQVGERLADKTLA
ncbi:lipid hydroperoxide peroxidase, partial [Pseudomonas syringae pv. tagetis]